MLSDKLLDLKILLTFKYVQNSWFTFFHSSVLILIVMVRKPAELPLVRTRKEMMLFKNCTRPLLIIV